MKIQIPEPCNENWDKMTPTEKGRFCGSCEKEVVDFTEMTKHEIQQYFVNRTTELTCGRIGKAQLTVLNQPEEQLTTRFIPKPWWIAAASIVFLAKPVLAQGLNQSNHQEAPLSQANSLPKVESVERADLKKEKFVISGVICDSLTKEPLFSAIVLIKNTKIGCRSDFDGNFEFEYSAKYKDSVIVKIKVLGYESKSIELVLSEKEINLDTIMLHTNIKINEVPTEIKTMKMGKMRMSEIKVPESVMTEENTSTDSSVNVSGVIFDSINQESIIGSIINIKGTKIGCSTDLDGNFKLTVPKDFQDSVTLEVRSVGYETKTIKILLSQGEIHLDSIFLNLRSNVHPCYETEEAYVGQMRISEIKIPRSAIHEVETSVVISGTILDELGDTMAFATILIKGTEFGTTTDINGRFELVVPPEYQDTLTLTTSFIGYEPISINLIDIKKDTNIGEIKFSAQYISVMGGMMGTMVYKPTFFGRITGFFWRLFH